MRLQELCDGIVDDVDGALGCALVDLVTGLPLVSRIVPGGVLSSASMEAISAAGADYFRGRAIRRLAGAMSDESESHFVHELQTTTEDTYHFMSVVAGREDTLMILITDKSANLGLRWISMREALARVREEDGVEGSEGVFPQRREPNANLQDVEMFHTSWRGGRAHRRR
ncbi:MAG: hypothetical protein OXT64_17505 [Gammaproteobacteria bacterium]|nr:hypothetical protein [Gammaproteobacteria bacterium]